MWMSLLINWFQRRSSAPLRAMLAIGLIGFCAWLLLIVLSGHKPLCDWFHHMLPWLSWDALLLGVLIMGWCGLAYGVHRGRHIKQEIRAQCAAEYRAKQLSTHDALTLLPQRQALEDHFESICHQEEPLWVVTMDLDGFKAINVLHGHQTGDRLLQEVARRLLASLPPQDLACRVGNDEFVLLVRSVTCREALEALVQRLADNLVEPIVLGEPEVCISASYGAACYPLDGQEFSQLLRRADLALLQGRQLRRGGLRFFDPQADQAVEEHTLTVQMVREAIQKDYLNVVYQPIMNLDGLSIVGCEALVRLEHPEKGPINPLTLIQVAEENGLIMALTSTLLERCCREALGWPQTVYLSFNLSAIDLRDENLPQRVTNILMKTGLPAKRLELEVTETSLVQDIELARDSLQQLRQLGIRISIDDFGTGYSSLAQISRFNFDKLKVDRAFVQGMQDSNKDTCIVQLILSLSQGLGMAVVAEGIESAQQLQWLQRMGCQYGQGYHFSRPVALAQLGKLFESAEPQAASHFPWWWPAPSHPKKASPKRGHISN